MLYQCQGEIKGGVHPEVIVDKIGFGGLSSLILLYKSVKFLNPFMISS